MKHIAILLLSVLCFTLQAQAQTYTQHIQQKEPGKGSVKVTQSKEIDNLVNGVNTKPQKKEKTDTGNYIGQPRHYAPETTAEKEKALKEKEKALKEKEAAAKEAERKRAEAEKKQESDEEMSIPTVDMRKKVMRHATKVTGYRVQAFAGGNTRADKQRAQQIGDAIKMRYPDQPVYVHFYSPRWICRVGNFRSYAEAGRMLSAVKKMGYKGATIVKGKITVFE